MTPQPEPLLDAADLPAPRLQLRWQKDADGTWACRYELVVPAHRNDIRATDTGVWVRELGRTRVSGCGKLSMANQIDRPFRDGAHAGWDSHALGIPAYAVDGDRAARIPAKPHPGAQDEIAPQS